MGRDAITVEYTMRWVEVNGASLRYELRGQGPQTLVLAHELRGMLAGMNRDADYAKAACPTLAIAAEHDMLRPPAVIEPIAGAIPNARFVVARSGHFMAVQTPELFLEHVLPFLGDYNGAD
jgi:3-oxoadipate enol-lactonase